MTLIDLSAALQHSRSLSTINALQLIMSAIFSKGIPALRVRVLRCHGSSGFRGGRAGSAPPPWRRQW